MPFLHVFTNFDTQQGYAIMWAESFRLLENVGNAKVRFSYMSNPPTNIGLKTIASDLCGKQAGGEFILYICKAYANTFRAERSVKLY